MDAKERLSEAWYCYQQIQAQLHDVERLRSLAEKCTTSFSLAPTNGGTGDRIPDAVARIMEIEEEVNNRIEEYKEARKNVEDYINDNVPHGPMSVVLYRRYIMMERWEHIATGMCYSIQHVWRLHGRALKFLNSNMRENAS